MITPELIAYIRRQLATGASQENVTKLLVQNGWSPQDVAEAYRASFPNAPGTSPAPLSSVSAADQISKPTSLVGRKIALSSVLIASSALYAFFQYTDSAKQDSALVVAMPVQGQVSQPLAVSTPPQEGQLAPAPITQPIAAPKTPTPVSTPALVQTPKPTPAPTPKPVPTPAPKPKGQYADGTYTGSPANAYYGTVQVRAAIQNGRLVDVQFLQYPRDRQRSQSISNYALPILRQEAISAQSANVNGVSGASDTSPAFVQSLGSALAQAKN